MSFEPALNHSVRFSGIWRDYGPVDVERLSGSFQIRHTLAEMGAALPVDQVERLMAAGDEGVARVGVELATELCEQLLEAGAPGLHFYTLNRSTATREIWAALDLPKAAAA